MIQTRSFAAAIILVMLECAAAAPRAGADPSPDSLAAVPDSLARDSHAADSVQTSSNGPIAGAYQTRSGSYVARLTRATRNFASDVWYVSASPARIHPSTALAILAVAGAEAAVYANDQPITDAVMRNQDQSVMHEVIEAGKVIAPLGYMNRTMPYYAGAWVVGEAFHVSKLKEISSEIIESHLIAGGVRNILKPLVGRRHPFENEGPRAFSFGNGTSFPSGHTSIYFELATILSHHAHSPPVTVLLYGWALTGCVERVSSRAHWPSDVFLPAVTGTVIAQTVVRRNEHRVARWHPTLGMRDDELRAGFARSF